MTDTCADCGRSTALRDHGDFYAAHDSVWQLAASDGARFLCFDCLEARLGRPLVEADFISLPWEIAARFAGEAGTPLLPEQRQRRLEEWREYTANNMPSSVTPKA